MLWPQVLLFIAVVSRRTFLACRRCGADVEIRSIVLIFGLFGLAKIVGRQVFSFAALVCWTLWKARNEFYFEHHHTSPKETIYRAEKAFREYQDWVQSPSTPMSSSRTTQSSAWLPPPLGIIKINTDAALNLDDSGSGVGFIMRDDQGHILLAVSTPCSFLSLAIGEAMAIKAALEAAITHAFMKL
ncbi:hypothetical protein NE237_014992 [Protea cynaroides]|uniref:RNase H type-1 domain-containing protein n=1 Tax=Protea cynaroides TaxID=273540 RepID=A0A9Q0KD28_9MAGN|nr:hypothetical protein NE237_014992 [Protea cynaroides]